MDDKSRNSGTETNNTEDSPQKSARRRRTPSTEQSNKGDVKGKRRSRSRTHSRSISKSSRSRSPSRDRTRRHRSRSRGHFSPDRRYGRFNRGGYQRDFFNRRRSRSPAYRGRTNRNARRSRSSSFERYRNRRKTSASRDRSTSQDRSESGRPPQPPPAPNFQNDYPTPHFQPEYPIAQPPFSNQQQFGNYDYVPMMQAPPSTFPAYPPPPSQEFMWNAQVPPPPIISCAPAQSEPLSTPTKSVSSEPEEEKQKRQAAIAAEKKIQRDTIRKQRDDYIRRASALKRELKTLQEQREELITGTAPPSPTTHGFIKENDRLQSQIENKIGTIENVIEMLNGILNADKSDTESPKKPKPAPKPEANSDDSSPERLKTKVIESLSKKRKDSDRNRNDEKSSKSSAPALPSEQINYTFFDPEQHWCKICSAFPKTAKEYLIHLHSEEHKNNAKPPEIPWHDNLVKDDMPTYANAPTKRTPIRGLQFFIPSTAWYCKLCSIWIGDLHCASSHLKSKTHAKEYDKFSAKNPLFENEWLEERQKAFDVHRENHTDQSQKVIAPPSPPIISAPKQIAPPPPPLAPSQVAPFLNTQNRVFDGIPLQINQRSKEIKEVAVVPSDEGEKKKGKKKKKEKKKRKKSKKKHRHSSSSSSSSSDDSSASLSPERKTSVEAPIDSSSSIRVAMRNAVNAAPARTHLKPKSDDEENARDAGGWTVVQAEPKAIPPKPPTISANGEAQNRRDDAMLSQWTPLPVISEKEKQLFEQLKGKLKNREDKKKEKTPPPKTAPNVGQAAPHHENSNDRSSKSNDKHEKEFKDVKEKEKDRRDVYRKRRSRSPSTPRRDRRSRSPRRDRRRRSRSPSPRRDRRYSRSPKRDRRRDRYSRSKSRDRRVEKNDSKSEKSSKTSDKPAKKPPSATVHTGKKLPFIGRMPVFKKQSTEDESKKLEPMNEANEEEQRIKKKKQDELKFQIHQKQQMLQLQQKQAEAYNLAHPGQFANIYSTHGTIHHILPAVQPEEYDLMPDPMQYANLMTAAPPPPMPEVEVPHYEEASEPVLPPGIDVEEAENMELELPPPPPPSDRDNLPKDFQDALSIIFDKGAEKANDDTTTAQVANFQPTAADGEKSNDILMQDEMPTFAQADIDSQHSRVEHEQTAMGVANMEIDDQPQYMLYTEEQYTQNHVQQQLQVPSVEPPKSGDLSTQNIPTPPIQILDAAGNLTQIPGPVLEVGSDFVMLDPDGNRIDNYAMDQTINVAKKDTGLSEHDIELQQKRKQELDDLAMLGIDVGDLAAQCL